MTSLESGRIGPLARPATERRLGVAAFRLDVGVTQRGTPREVHLPDVGLIERTIVLTRADAHHHVVTDNADAHVSVDHEAETTDPAERNSSGGIVDGVALLRP